MRRKQPRYFDMIRRMVRETDELRRPGVHHLEVRHDDGCAHWDGRVCDCDPEVVGGKRVDERYGGDGRD